MSLPREILDQLLSGYLDDALSADERARVQQLLESDPAVAGDLEELRGIRRRLRDLAKADSAIQLPSGFTDRVLDAAVASARSEGLSDDHPLIRLAEQPSPKPSNDSPSTVSWRAASVLVALAASIVVAVVALRPASDSPKGGGVEVAMSTDQGNSESVPSQGSDTRVAQSNPPDQGLDAKSVATGSVDPSSPQNSIAAMETPEPGVMTENAVGDSENADTQSPAAAAIAASGSSLPNSRGSNETITTPEIISNANSDPRNRASLAAILVLDIKRSERGRQLDAVTSAMRAAGIGAASERRVTEEIVGIANGVEDATTDAEASILYLQVSAKRLDRFILKMVLDQENIDSVRFMLAEDAPTLGIVQSLQPLDPTEVRHTGAWQMSSDSEDLVRAIANDLSGRPNYLSIDRTTAQVCAASMLSDSQSVGPDVMSQVLMIIR